MADAIGLVETPEGASTQPLRHRPGFQPALE
jgi:hypothetical protein